MDIARKIIYIITLLLAFMQTVKADVAYDEPFRFITQENGLSGETVSSILTDHLGQVWLATSNGVSRFNGKRIVTFSFSGEGRGATYVYDLSEGHDGTLYAATSKGVFILQKGSNHFTHIFPPFLKLRRFSQQPAYSISAIATGCISTMENISKQSLSAPQKWA